MPFRHAILALCIGLMAAPLPAQNPGGPRASAPLPAEPELPASDLLLRYESPALRFRWSLAPEAALEPALVRDMRREAQSEREKQIREADAALAATRSGDRKIQYQWMERWQVESETDQLLAFSTRQSSYTGGAHGNVLMRGLIWDRGAERRIGFDELFTDPAAMKAQLTPAFCQALDAERAQRRQGQKLEAFSDCPDPTAYPIVPVGNGPITSFRVLVPPYEAGPWAEGVYEINVDPAPLLKLIAPRYQALFSSR